MKLPVAMLVLRRSSARDFEDEVAVLGSVDDKEVSGDEGLRAGRGRERGRGPRVPGKRLTEPTELSVFRKLGGRLARVLL